MNIGILEKLKSKRLYFDGGYGTMFQKCGLKPGEMCETWNVKKPEVVKDIHLKYLKAGCDILKANTFGANSLKFEESGECSLENIIKSAIENAKLAIEEFGNKEKYVALDIGPTGKLLKPLGDLEFEDAVNIFKQTVSLGVKNGADLILIETMNDSYETKAAVIAAKEQSDLPVFVTNTYDESAKLMTGASPAAMAALLEGLRADAIGINCGLGPDKMLGIVKELIRCSSVPVIVNPNAGLPAVKNGKTVYDIEPKEFSKTMQTIANLGASVLGGCCGTTPEHIKELCDKTKDIEFKPVLKKDITVVSSYTHAKEFGKRCVLIGERINPTGKKAFKEALRNKDYDYILREGVSQQEAGANILDVNVGLPEIDEKQTLKTAVQLLQTVSDLPLQIDTSDASAMEAALRVYNGKPLINSVNGKKEIMEKIFPLAAKYGGAVIALTLDESGIPETAEGRIEIAKKIIDTAKTYGIDKKDIIVDPLALTISSDSSSASETLKCLEYFSKNNIKTSLGVSNVSFGLPKRNIINSTFFALAMHCGLSAAIMNPHSKEMMDVYHSFCALANLDDMCKGYIEYASKQAPDDINKNTNESASPKQMLCHAILKGLKDESKTLARQLILNGHDPIKIIDKCIVSALNEIGSAFEEKKAFLPQLLMSAEAAKSAFDAIKENGFSESTKKENRFKIVLATVRGDIHDIGKNIVKALLENYDFDVLDLGKDVKSETVLKAAKENNVSLVGLSALMTTTVPAMEETIKLVKKNLPDCKIVVGGAVLTKEYADMIGADKYAKDAMETVRYAQSLAKKTK